MPDGLLLGRGASPGPLTSAYPPIQRSMVRVLHDRALQHPAKDVVVFDSTDHLTYGQAWAGACRVGHRLDQLGLGARDHVGLLLRNQPEFIQAYYGAQVRGGVVVPLNAESRGPLLQSVIERSDVRALVVRSDLLDRLQSLDGLGATELVVVAGGGPLPASVHGVPVVGWAQWLAGAPEHHGWPFPDYDELAQIQFTSGTTAAQKGAMCPHHFVYLYASLVADSIGRGPDDPWTTPMPLYHAAALHVITNSGIHAGATSHLKSRFSASQFWAQAARDGATWSVIMGPMAAMIAKMTPDPVPEHRMRSLFCPPPPPELEEFERRFHTTVLYHGFGMTEIYPMPVSPRNEPGLPIDTIGHPVDWMEYGVVDEHDEMLPPGEVGEIVFRPRWPHAMVSGYYRDPARTAEVFRNLMFHTGDLGTIDGGFRLHYRGRRQERIRRRGENIAAPELEWVVLRHPAVVECAAYGVPSELGEEEVKVDVVLRAPLEMADLHAWLVENTPRYMVPRYLEVHAAFPKTPSERVEKYRLRERPVDRPEVWDAGRGPGRP